MGILYLRLQLLLAQLDPDTSLVDGLEEQPVVRMF